MRPGIYDDNKQRSYPLVRVPGVPEIPTQVLVDCEFDFAAYAGFTPGVNKVWLSRISSDATNVYLRFSTDAEELTSIVLDFTVPRAGREFITAFSSVDATFPANTPCSAQLAWHGFVVVCDRQAIVDLTGSGPLTLSADQNTVEPALVRAMDGSYVRSVSVANERRTLVTDTFETVRPYIVYATCLQGDLQFGEGNNIRISVDETNNGLVFGAAVGAGRGVTCEEIPLAEDEVSPDSGTLLSGGPRCTEVVKRINGLVGPAIGLRGAQGFDIQRDPENASKLNIVLDPSLLPRPT